MNRSPLILVDGHAHLDLLEGAEEQVKKAASLGVLAVIGVSMGAASMERTLDLGERFPGVVLPALGLHPWQIDREDVEEALAVLEDNLHRADALGEIGLDYKLKTKKSIQKDLFARQLRIATDTDLPVILHCRYSHERVFQMVAEAEVPRAVFHWYTGPLDLIDKIVDRGDFVSATPALAYSRMHQEAIRYAPLGHILLETDCPVAYEGEEATPSTVLRVCDQVALLKGCSPAEVAGRTTDNVKRFLGKAWKESGA